MKDMEKHSIALFALFMPLASRIYLEIFSALFGEGQSSIDFKSIASQALRDCAQDVAGFKAAYTFHRDHPLVLHLTGNMSDAWDFSLGSITTHGLSRLLYKEGTTYVRYFVV